MVVNGICSQTREGEPAVTVAYQPGEDHTWLAQQHKASVCGAGQKREAMSPGSLGESGDHREVRLQWEEGG